MTLGILLLGVLITSASYRIGRGHEIKGSAIGGPELGEPSSLVRKHPPNVLETYRRAARSDPGVRAGRTTVQVLGVLRRSSIKPGIEIDPEANADWLVNRAETDEERDEAAVFAIRNWVRADPGAAEGWLESRGVAGEKAIGIMVNGYAARDVDRAIEWAQRASASKRNALIAQAIAYAVFRNTIKKTAIGDYTGNGSLSKEEMEEKVRTALNRINTSRGL